ncbi:kinase-like protein [Coniophora puteana RWD-64-598 SS2]|uniref:Kinase-like protein n=1 Tax=Coniophora puteana (strain RWD-64-598) TaxID=741705 RepID=A0A5M3MZ33_CONPW|nr:kinase-like protein [Coniophora puteana RWD-64-598 SS2]EIW84423.1 kinase-like protein [Coniophora puteana RWD-64-598 SS2]
MLRYSANRPIPQQAHTPLSEKIGDAEQKIRKEIAIMKKLRHGHIVRLIEVIDDKLNDRIYMVMEYLSGGEVKWRIKAREEHPCYEPILQLDQVRRIIRDVILGLEYLHYQGIIHRDIKPGNLLWTADRQMVKISDFGVSTFSYAQRLAAAGRSKVEADDTDPLLLDDSDLSKRSGTPSFLAPEIIAEYERASDASPTSTSTSFLSSATAHASPTTSSRSKRKITKAIDVWALGVTLYCLLFGDCPFHPPPGIGGSAAEFALYTVICNEDWTPRKTMAYGRIPTGGRHPGRSAPSEARVVIRILDGLLQKDQHKRMTLDQLKVCRPEPS